MNGLKRQWLVIPCVLPTVGQLKKVFSSVAELCQKLDAELDNEFAWNGECTLIFNLDGTRNLPVEDFNTVCKKVSTYFVIKSWGLSINNNNQSVELFMSNN